MLCILMNRAGTCVARHTQGGWCGMKKASRETWCHWSKLCMGAKVTVSGHACSSLCDVVPMAGRKSSRSRR